ncbi:MAG TPA: DnaA/Hda family protein [Caulobacteraceae bacterium]|nr:DnaA/Hda family protein [Caulobacteraceae bacterium]
MVSASNRAAAEALAAWPDAVGGALALVGPEGAGKSHLAADWAERTGAVMLNDVAAELANLSEFEGRPVVLDGAESVDDETLFHLINLAQAEGGALLLTARTPPSAWETALPDLRSRLNAIRVVQVHEPDDDVLKGVLQRLFADRAITPSPELIEYLARRIERSIPAARRIVAELDADAGSRPITRALARELLEKEPAGGDLFD